MLADTENRGGTEKRRKDKGMRLPSKYGSLKILALTLTRTLIFLGIVP
jgi:hypothetical protein